MYVYLYMSFLENGGLKFKLSTFYSQNYKIFTLFLYILLL